MRPTVHQVSSFFERLGIGLQCPIEGCNMQGAYEDHITSTNGSHFKNLWQKGIPFDDHVPLEQLKERAWEQKNIRGGAVRFNHLDWEVQMWKGAPPPNPVFGRSIRDIPQDAQPMRGIQDGLRALTFCVPCGLHAERVALVQLPRGNQWYQAQDRASEPTSDKGDWRSIPHIVRGRRNWAENMKDRAENLFKVLQAFNLYPDQCALCPTGRGWEEHVPGPVHWKRITDILGERPIADVRDDLWQQWLVHQNGLRGAVRFNHLDGEIQIRRDDPHGEAPPPPPPTLPSAPAMARPPPPTYGTLPSAPATAQPPPSTLPTAALPSGAQRAQPPPIGAAASRMLQPVDPLESSRREPGPPADASAWMKVMWQQIAQEAAAKLEFHFDGAHVPEDKRVCSVCSAPLAQNIEMHLRSDSHWSELTQTVNYMSDENSTWSESVSGALGPRVQKFEGQCGEVWFNHVTGESGSDCAERGYPLTEWEKYDYSQTGGGCFWYSRVNGRYFEVKDYYGTDKGVWL